MKIITNARKVIQSEAFRYLFAGGCATILNVAIFGFLCYCTKLGETVTGITVSNIISIVFTILFAFVTNKLFVFNSHSNSKKEVAREMTMFCVARTGTMAMEVGGVFLLVNILGLSPFAGKLIMQIIVIIGNYILSKTIIFPSPRK